MYLSIDSCEEFPSALPSKVYNLGLGQLTGVLRAGWMGRRSLNITLTEVSRCRLEVAHSVIVLR